MSYIPNSNPQPMTRLPTGSIYFRRFGYNSSVGTTHELIDFSGAALPYMPLAATLVEVLSSSANDTYLGTGARTLMITGLSSTFAYLTETINLNGTSVVTSSNSFIRVFKAEVITVGTYGGSNLGSITIQSAATSTLFLAVPIDYGQSYSAHFTIPDGYYGSISGANLSADSGKILDVHVRSRDNAKDVTAPYGTTSIAQVFTGVSGGGINHLDYDPPIILGPTTDVYITAAVSTGTASVSIEYWGWISPIN